MDAPILNLINKLHFVSTKLHIYHWNVKGVDFITFHLFLEAAYKELLEQKDKLAEYLRFNGKKAIVDFSEVKKLSEGLQVPDSAKEMFASVLSDYTDIIEIYKSLETDVVLEAIVSDALKELSKRIYFIQSTLN